MSTASFKFWFPAFFFIFYFSSITTPWDSKIFCYHRRHVRNWLLLLKVKNNQSAVYRVLVSIPAKFQSFIRTCTPPYVTKSTEKIPQLSDTFSELCKSHFIEKNANPEAKLQPKANFNLSFISKESAPKRQVTSPCHGRPGSLATNITTWRPLSWVKR